MSDWIKARYGRVGEALATELKAQGHPYPNTGADLAIKALSEACTILTTEDLDELPVGTVVLSNAQLVVGKWNIPDVAQKGVLGWFYAADSNASPSDGIDLPARVIWHPSWEA